MELPDTKGVTPLRHQIKGTASVSCKLIDSPFVEIWATEHGEIGGVGQHTGDEFSARLE